VWGACRSSLILEDLAVKFIMTERPVGFVISDHPVVAYNQFAERHPKFRHYPVTTGLAVKGLQLFLPISPSVMLAVYDPGTYSLGGHSRVCRAGPRDVDYLNAMQAVNAFNCIYFDRRRCTDVTLKALLEQRARHRRMGATEVAKSAMLHRPDGSMSRFVAVTHTEVRVGASLSFVRIEDEKPYDEYEGPTPPIRSPERLEFTKGFGEFLDELVDEGRESLGLPPLSRDARKPR
jgi:hypothetical protein